MPELRMRRRALRRSRACTRSPSTKLDSRRLADSTKTQSSSSSPRSAAARDLYVLTDLPKRAELEAIFEPCRPYRSVAAWYLWCSMDAVTP
jgi:hypothetical protein